MLSGVAVRWSVNSFISSRLVEAEREPHAALEPVAHVRNNMALIQLAHTRKRIDQSNIGFAKRRRSEDTCLLFVLCRNTNAQLALNRDPVGPERHANSTVVTIYPASRKAATRLSRCSRSRASHSMSVIRPFAGKVVKMRW